MQPSDIKSRPLYAALNPSPLARRHIVAAEGEGFAAIEEAFSGKHDLLARLAVVYTPGGSAPKAPAERLAALKPDALHLAPSVETALVRLGSLLAHATMGTHLSLTGTENFIAQGVVVAMAHGIGEASIGREHRGSLAKRVQCVHCKGFTAGVAASPVACSHCGIWLFVRDHYSRRLGAFMGVSIDAEAPGEVPASEEFQA